MNSKARRVGPGATLPAPRNPQWSQAMTRNERVWKDQHGREYDCTCEARTDAPLQIRPRFAAPVMPPDRFLRIMDRVAGTFKVDYPAWIEDRQKAHDYYQARLTTIASDQYNQRAEEMIRAADPWLRRQAGEPPEPVEQIKAARDGSAWALGMSDERPAWADKYFPVRIEVEDRPWLEDADAPFRPDEEAETPAPDTGFVERTVVVAGPALGASIPLDRFPLYLTSGTWLFSDGSESRFEGNGTREKAEARERQVRQEREAAPAAVTGVAGPGWDRKE